MVHGLILWHEIPNSCLEYKARFTIWAKVKSMSQVLHESTTNEMFLLSCIGRRLILQQTEVHTQKMSLVQDEPCITS